MSVAICIGFLAGVVVYTLLNVWVLVVACLGCAAASLCVRRVMMWVVVLSVLCGVGYAALRTPQIAHTFSVTEGVITSLKEQSESRQVFRVRSAHGVVQVTAPPAPLLELHDTVKMNCEAQRPSSTTFAYEQYLWSQGVTHVCRVWSVDVQYSAEDMRSRMFAFQRAMIDRVQRSLDEPASSLVLSMVFGDETYLSDTLVNDFRTTGLTHVLVVSGMQIIVLLQVIEWLGVRARLSRVQRFLFLCAIACWYVMLTGAQASIVRAALTIGVAYALRMCGRVRGNAGRIIVYAATVMTLVHVYQPVYDVGFQLSFAATFGLLSIAPYIAKRIQSVVPTLFAQPIAQSVGASVCSMLVVAFHFRTLSLVGIFANILLAHIWSMVTLAGFVWSCAAMIFPSTLSMVQLPFTLCFRILAWCVHALASIPYASLSF